MVRLQRSRQCLHRPDRQWLCLGLQYRRVQSLCGNTSYGPVSFKATAAIWTNSKETHYVYDGMLVVQERDGSNTPQVSYTRGQDLGGDNQSDGGIGGMLAYTGSGVTHYYHADGLGNVTAMVNVNNQLSAGYNYDPFGNLLGSGGPMADLNHYRFSSKEIHPGSGTYSYGYRFYDPNLQRWLNRDPVEETGGINLYGFVGNRSLNTVDPFGLCDKASSLAKGDIADVPDSGDNGGTGQFSQASLDYRDANIVAAKAAIDLTPMANAAILFWTDLYGGKPDTTDKVMAGLSFLPTEALFSLVKGPLLKCKKQLRRGTRHGI